MLIDHSGKTLPSGVVVLRKTDERNNQGAFIYVFKCFCGKEFKRVFRKDKLKSCGCLKNINHSGKILDSGIEILEKTSMRDISGESLYMMKCHCGNIFHRRYQSLIRSCGCLNEIDHSGEILDSGIEILEKVGREKKITFYKMKCHCGNVFKEQYRPNQKSCGCLKNINHSGKILDSGIEILERLDTLDNGKVMYKMKCHCGNVFINYYFPKRKGCSNCISTGEYQSNVDKDNFFYEYLRKDHSGKILDSGIEILERLDTLDNGKVMYKMKCHCGNVFMGTFNHSRKCCPLCRYVDKEVLSLRKGMKGQSFGRLTTVKDVGSNKYKQRLWECKCDCGKLVVTAYHNLTEGKTKSCGCLNKETSKKQIKKLTDKYVVHGTNLNLISDTSKTYKNNTTGHRGISIDHNKFRARITFQGVVYNLGTFTDINEAIEVRKCAEEKLFKGFLNWYHSLDKNKNK